MSRSVQKNSNSLESLSKDNENYKNVLTPQQKNAFTKKLYRQKLIRTLEKMGVPRKSGVIGGKKNKNKKNKNKTRKKYKQKGGMPLVFHNLFDGVSFLGSSFLNTLNGVPHSANPLPFLGQFII